MSEVFKRALVTGGNAGLGAAMVSRLLDAGWHVVSIDREESAAFDRLMHIVCDLSDRDAVDELAPVLVAGGPYSLVVFNAGASATGRFEEIPMDAYRRLVTLNAETPMALAAALMRGRAVRGHMCFISSLSHFTGYPGAAVYAATKDALAVYAKSVRKPFARAGVSVTVAFPGPMRTDHAERHAPQGADASRRMHPDKAAAVILDATLKGRRRIMPGMAAKLIAVSGALMPKFPARQMTRLIFEKLGKPVW